MYFNILHVQEDWLFENNMAYPCHSTYMFIKLDDGINQFVKYNKHDNHGNIYIHLYIFTAIVKYLTRVEYLSNCCVTKESIGFSSKKKRNKYEVYFISGNLLKKIKKLLYWFTTCYFNYSSLQQLSCFNGKNLKETLEM